MPDPATIQRLRGLALSAVELRQMNPGWTDAQISDYLDILENFITIANLLDKQIDLKLEEIETDFSDGSIPFAEGGFLKESNSNLFWDSINNTLKIVGTIQSQGRIKGSIIVTNAMSPYDIHRTDETVFADTDTGSIILNLPDGLDGDFLRIINAGTSNNNVTLIPYGTDLIYGENSSEIIYDIENIEIQYEVTKGWH